MRNTGRYENKLNVKKIARLNWGWIFRILGTVE